MNLKPTAYILRKLLACEFTKLLRKDRGDLNCVVVKFFVEIVSKGFQVLDDGKSETTSSWPYLHDIKSDWYF